MKSRTPSKCESRRLEARRQHSEHRRDRWQDALQRMNPNILLIWAGFYAAALLILLAGNESMPWRLNQRVDHDITARVGFDFEDQARTDRERRSASNAAPNVFVLNDKTIDAVTKRATNLLAVIQSTPDDSKVKSALAADGLIVDGPALIALRQWTGDQKKKDSYQGLVDTLVRQMQDKYIVEPPGDSFRREGNKPPISVLRRTDQPDRKVLSDQLIQVNNAKVVEQTCKQLAAEAFPKPLQDVFAQLLFRTILGPSGSKDYKPIWSYDHPATTKEMEDAERAVPPSIISIKKGDLLVASGTVLSDTGTELGILKQEHRQFIAAQKSDPILYRQTLLMKLGIAGIGLLITLGLAIYTIVYQQRIFDRPMRTLGLAGLVLVMVLLSRMNERAQYPWDLPVEFTVAFVFIAGALLTIAYDQRLALGVSGALAILATVASRGDLGLFLTLIASVSVAIFSLKEVRSRSKIVFVGALSAIGAMIAATSSGLIAGQDAKYVLVHAASAAGAALAGGFIVQGILPNFERIFGVATSMTLLEWCDVSRPLLRRLAQEAPGTYSHSLILSQMAEEAAEAIGARGLLVRVGALYHDIGKIQKSEYFVENQDIRMNRHERLTPTMSLLIIVGHVKDGVELARAYGVPRILYQFIAEHHGTTVVRYFHHAASEAARSKGRPDRAISETEFRYPGPKPHSKESAILMLCDGCEGAVRSLAEPTPGRIESTVHQVVMDRLTDGQFEECDITLRELHLVEQSLVKSLGAIHHGRLKYPKAPDRDRAADADSDVGRKEAVGKSPVPAPSRTPEVARPA